MLRQLQSGRLIGRDEDDRDRLILTEEGRRVLRGEAPFALREDVVNRKTRRRRPPKRARRAMRIRSSSLRSRPYEARSLWRRNSRPMSFSPIGR